MTLRNVFQLLLGLLSVLLMLWLYFFSVVAAHVYVTSLYGL